MSNNRNTSINMSQLTFAIDELRKQTDVFDNQINTMMKVLEQEKATEEQKIDAIILLDTNCKASIKSASSSIKAAFFKVLAAATPQATIGAFMPFQYKNGPAPFDWEKNNKEFLFIKNKK